MVDFNFFILFVFIYENVHFKKYTKSVAFGIRNCSYGSIFIIWRCIWNGYLATSAINISEGEAFLNTKYHFLFMFDVAQINYRKWKTPEDLEIKLTDWIEASIGKFSKH